MKAHANSGFTLVELCFGATILVAVLLAVGGAHGTLNRLLNTASTLGTLQQRTMVAMDKIATELKWAEADALLVTSESGSARLDLRVPIGFLGGQPVWSPTITYKVVPATGDSNGNGLHDEYRLVRQQAGTAERTVCSDLAAGGFAAVRSGNSIVLTLRVERRADGRNHRHDATTSVGLRN